MKGILGVLCILSHKEWTHDKIKLTGNMIPSSKLGVWNHRRLTNHVTWREVLCVCVWRKWECNEKWVFQISYGVLESKVTNNTVIVVGVVYFKYAQVRSILVKRDRIFAMWLLKWLISSLSPYDTYYHSIIMKRDLNSIYSVLAFRSL